MRNNPEGGGGWECQRESEAPLTSRGRGRLGERETPGLRWRVPHAPLWFDEAPLARPSGGLNGAEEYGVNIFSIWEFSVDFGNCIQDYFKEE